jgi:hypothetical protein
MTLRAPLEVVEYDGRVFLLDANGRSVELLIGQQTGLRAQPVVTREERIDIAHDLANAFNLEH